MSSDMRGEAPAVTEDSDLVDIIRETYRGRIGNNHKTADYCVGGAVCHYFSEPFHDLHKFPFVDHLREELVYIVEQHGNTALSNYDLLHPDADVGDSEDLRVEITDTCNYYASAIINANDGGEYDDAWIHVDMFIKEFGIDD